MRRLALALFANVLAISGAAADTPRVVTDIAPVQALVAQVMRGVGAPDLLIPPGATPHSYAMRPSEARNLAQADLVVWVGPVLTAWLAEPMAALAPDARAMALLDVPGTLVLENRTGVAFEAHAHGEDHDPAETHAGEAEGHTEEHADHDDHGPNGIDPHLWLDPVNASLWLGAIADVLADMDSENGPLYRANAATAKADLAVLQETLRDRLTPLAGRPFVVFHDAFHYFEARFDIEARAAVSLSDGAAPSAARLAKVRQVIADTGASCVFTEPQFNAGLIGALAQEGRVLRSAALDPLGASLAQDNTLYGDLLTGIADAFESCLGE